MWPKSHPFHWLKKAENGNSDAMVQLGIIYDRDNEDEKAFYWYQKATDAGDEYGRERLVSLKKRSGREQGVGNGPGAVKEMKTAEQSSGKSDIHAKSVNKNGPKIDVSDLVSMRENRNTLTAKNANHERWTIRIVSLANTDQNLKNAKNLAIKIHNSLGYNTFVAFANNRKSLLVCVGKFDDRKSVDLVNAQKTLKDFEYEGKKQFRDCYPVEIR